VIETVRLSSGFGAAAGADDATDAVGRLMLMLASEA
jgi:hypothetical protein